MNISAFRIAIKDSLPLLGYGSVTSSLEHNSPSFKQSLAFNTLLNMVLRLALVVLLISGVSYWHLMSQLANATQTQLFEYINERGQREGSTFVLAQDNHTLLRNEFLAKFNAQNAQSDQNLPRFEERFFHWSDGTVRNAPEGTFSENFDTLHNPTAFVQSDVELTTDFQKRLLLSESLVKQYGAGWRDRFLDTYISFPEGANIVLWPGVAWGIDAKSDLYIPDEEWAYLGNHTHNPERKTVWTGVYADPVSQDWMVSAETPIDDANGRHLATIGHDIVLNTLIKRVLDDHLDGAYNLLMRTDGQLIVEPHLMEEIRASEGALNVQTMGNSHLKTIFELAKQTTAKGSNVVYNRTEREYLAVSQLEGPNWYLVTVYPEKLLQAQALDNTRFLLGLGLASLILEILLLWIVLQRKIKTPLEAILGATQQITEGDFSVNLDTHRQDELGQIATSFTKMTYQLKKAFTELEKKLEELKAAQLSMVQSEKMSALGNLVAGVAHEINNPVGCIIGNVGAAQNYINDLLGLIDLYAEEVPNPGDNLIEEIEEIDLDYVRQDLPKLIRAMKDSGERIKSISRSLRTFSRADTEEKQSFDLHDGLDSTVLILRHRLKANEQRPAIEVVKAYGEVPTVGCFPGQLNQVFMNLLANAIDVFDEVAEQSTFTELKNKPQTITVTTAMLTEEKAVEIRIKDNGTGMPETVRARVFDHLFTTKGVGKGTGLGLAIAHQIITEAHGGSITVNSDPGKGTEFCIHLPIAAVSG